MPPTKSAAPKKIKVFVPPKRLERVQRTQTLKSGTVMDVAEQAAIFAAKHGCPPTDVRIVFGRYASPYLLAVTPETEAERIARGKRLARDRKERAEHARRQRAHEAERLATQKEIDRLKIVRADPVAALIESPAFTKAIEAGVAAGIKAAGIKT